MQAIAPQYTIQCVLCYPSLFELPSLCINSSERPLVQLQGMLCIRLTQRNYDDVPRNRADHDSDALHLVFR